MSASVPVSSPSRVPWTWGDVLALVLGPLGGGALLTAAFPSVGFWVLYVGLALTGTTGLGSLLVVTTMAAMSWLAILLGSAVFTATAFLRWSRRGLLRGVALALVLFAAPVALFPVLFYVYHIVGLLTGRIPIERF